jgi:3-hydroxyisobutyrate dehydrogenase
MTTTDIGAVRVAVIGYGEVGTIFSRALVAQGVAGVAAYDILVDTDRATELRARANRDGVTLATTNAQALVGATLVVSAVTAHSTFDAARTTATTIAPGAFYLDLNSASPRTKQRCGEAIGSAGGRYVEAAVMTSVPPYGLRVPMLLGGPDAQGVRALLDALGLRADVVADELGVASAIKMCRSVIIKGMEALFIESLLCARAHGVEDAVLASLGETFSGIDWEKNASYFWSRVVEHGRRRAEEMREAAAMVDEDGLAPSMAERTAERQAFVAALASAGVFAGVDASAGWRALADRALDALSNEAASARASPERCTS